MGVFAVVNDDCPDVDEDEEDDVCEFLEREEEGEDVVGQALRIAVHGMESVRGERRRHNPFVVGLVQRLVDALVVQTAVDPVDAKVGEADKQRKLQPVVPGSWTLLCRVVELRIAAHFSQEPWRGKDGHDREGDVGLFHLESNLILEVSWMGEGRLVKDEEIGCGREDIVDDDTE